MWTFIHVCKSYSRSKLFHIILPQKRNDFIPVVRSSYVRELWYALSSKFVFSGINIKIKYIHMKVELNQKL